MIRALSTLVAAVCAVFTVPSFVAAPTPTPGGGAVLAMHREFLQALDAGDAQAAQRFLAADTGPESARPCTLYLVGAGDTPASAVGNAESKALLARILDEQRAAGGAWETRITRSWSDCPTAEVSWAVLEFERTQEKDGVARTSRYRSTSIVRHDDGWKLTAWHVSPADATAAKVTATK